MIIKSKGIFFLLCFCLGYTVSDIVIDVARIVG